MVEGGRLVSGSADPWSSESIIGTPVGGPEFRWLLVCSCCVVGSSGRGLGLGTDGCRLLWGRRRRCRL